MGVALASQLLKSPTTATRVAPGARSTNVTGSVEASDGPATGTIAMGAWRPANLAPSHEPTASTATSVANTHTGRAWYSRTANQPRRPLARGVRSDASRAISRSRAGSSAADGCRYAARV